MFTPKVRFALIILTTIGLVISVIYHNNPSALLYGIVSIMLLVGYYRSGTVWLAFQQLRRQNYEKAARYLEQTKYPEKLAASQKGYYHFIKGFAAIDKEDFQVAQQEFEKAAETGLRTQNDEAIVYLQLADISLTHQDKSQAQEYLNKANSLKYKPAIAASIEKLQEQLDEA